MKIKSGIKKLNDKLIGPEAQQSTEKTLYTGTILILIVILIPVMISNYLIGLDAWVNYIIIFFAIPILVFLFFLARSHQLYKPGYLIVAFLFFLSAGWMFNGGAYGTVPLIYIVSSLALVGISKPRSHIFIFLIFFAHLSLMIILEEFYLTDYIVKYSEESMHYQDMIFSYGVSMLIVFWILRFYKLAYIKENNKLEKQKKELEHNISLKNMYFTIMVHDLKGSFNNILGFSELMTSDKDSTQEDLERLATLTNKSASQSFNLLEDIFEWSRIQQDTFKLVPEKIDLGKQVADILEKLCLSIESKELNIQNNISLGNWINSDSYYISTMLRNLLSNAVKFTPKQGIITLSCWDFNKNEIGISIHDNGIGMDEKLVQNLFKLEYNTKRRGTEGETSNGIGLKICKELTIKNGSQFFVESTKDKGSTFTFTVRKYH